MTTFTTTTTAVCKYCLIAITLFEMMCLAPAQMQQRHSLHHKILPESTTHAEIRFGTENSRLLDRKTEVLRHRRQNGKSEASAAAAFSVDQSEVIAKESSKIQAAIDNIFRFPNSKHPIEPPVQFESTVSRLTESGQSSLDVPECAQGRSFCDHQGDDYPADIIGNLISENQSQWVRFNTDDILTQEDLDINQRGDEAEEVQLCRSVVSKRSITRVQAEDKSWRIVVQSPELGVQQIVRVEVCQNPGSACDRRVSDGLPSSYRSTCKQKHIVRELLLVNETLPWSLYSGPVILESCCSCVLSKIPLADQEDDDMSATLTDDESYRSTDENHPSENNENKGCSQETVGTHNKPVGYRSGARNTTTGSSTSDCYGNRWLSLGLATSLMFVLYVCV